MDYRGQHCPICGKEFCDGDDIVVCPECGTPYHRECYKTAGHCVNEEHHGESFEWKPETAPHAEEKTPNVGQNANDDGHKVVFCPVCGRENPAEEPNCLNCGARLYNNQNGGKAFIPPVELPNMDKQPFGKVVNISPMDMLGRNTVGDTAEFIGVNAQTYIPKFYKMQQEKRSCRGTGRRSSLRRIGFSTVKCKISAVYLLRFCSLYRVRAPQSRLWRQAAMLCRSMKITQTARPLPRI